MLPETGIEFERQEECVEDRAETGDLVVVTSLIDKIPNLGGECTSSIKCIIIFLLWIV